MPVNQTDANRGDDEFPATSDTEEGAEETTEAERASESEDAPA